MNFVKVEIQYIDMGPYGIRVSIMFKKFHTHLHNYLLTLDPNIWNTSTPKYFRYMASEAVVEKFLENKVILGITSVEVKNAPVR